MPRSLLARCLVAASAAVAPACGAAPQPARPDPARAMSQPAPQPEQLSPVYHAQTSEYEMTEERVYQDAAAWAAAWEQLHNGMVVPPLPAVDFATSSVVLVAIGQRSSAGRDVRVTAVTRGAGGAVVHYTVTEPGPGCMTAQMVTSPVDVVRVPRIRGAARFERATVRRPC